MTKRYPEGAIPFGELVFPEDIALFSRDMLDEYRATSDLRTSWQQPITVYRRWAAYYTMLEQVNGSSVRVSVEDVYECDADSAALIIENTKYYSRIRYASSHSLTSPFGQETITVTLPSGEVLRRRSYDMTSTVADVYTHDGKTVYSLLHGYIRHDRYGIINSGVDPFVSRRPSDPGNAGAWTAIYGEVADVASAGNLVPVLWRSPYTDEYLSTAFPITVDNRGWVETVIDAVNGAIGANS